MKNTLFDALAMAFVVKFLFVEASVTQAVEPPNRVQSVEEKSKSERIHSLFEDAVGRLDSKVTRKDQASARTEMNAAINRQIDQLVSNEGNAALLVLHVLEHRRDLPRPRSQDDERKLWAGVLFLEHLLPRTSERQLIEVLAPHLSTKDLEFRKDLYEILNFKLRGHSCRDFGDVSFLLKKSNGKIEPHLVQYMLLQDPEGALLRLAAFFMKDREERKTLLLAYRTLDNAVWKQQVGLEKSPQVGAEELVALTTLAEHKQWWARLYGAEFVRQHPAFRQEKIVQTLSKDEHLLVREVMTTLPASKAK